MKFVEIIYISQQLFNYLFVSRCHLQLLLLIIFNLKLELYISIHHIVLHFIEY